MVFSEWRRGASFGLEKALINPDDESSTGLGTENVIQMVLLAQRTLFLGHGAPAMLWLESGAEGIFPGRVLQCV